MQDLVPYSRDVHVPRARLSARLAFATSASWLCLCLPAQGLAQTVQSPGESGQSQLVNSVQQPQAVVAESDASPAQQSDTPASANEAESDTDPDAEPGVIIVSGQRRAQALTDVPVTISVANQETLTAAAVVDTRALGQVLPGLVVAQKGSFVQPVVRGVSAQGTGPGLENSVPLYFDGVYMSDQLANLYEVSGIESIELLKGPQGTLYGRNAVGGAILVTTQDPELNGVWGSASIGYGSYDDVRASGFLNAQVSDRVAVSLSGLYHSNDGYYRNILRDGERDAGLEVGLIHGKIKWEVSDTVSLLASVMYLDSSDASGLAGIPLDDNTAARRIDPDVMLPDSVWEYAHNLSPRQDAEVLLTYLRSEVDIGGGTWTTLGSYRHNRVQISSDADYSPISVQEFNLTVPSETYSIESFYVSPTWGRFSFIVGASYYNADERYEPLDLTLRPVISAAVDPIKIFVFGQQQTESAAVYAEGQFDFSDQWSLVVGARYTDEKKVYNAERFFFTIPPGGTSYPPINDLSYSDLTPRASLRFKPSRQTTLYVTYSEGFKSGGFNPSTAAPDFVEPEQIVSYEAGFKVVGGWGAFNASVFHYDYTNLQVATIVGAVSATRNAAEATFNGVDLDGFIEISDGFQLNAAYSYVDAEYDEYADAVVNIPVPGGGNMGAVIDASGNPVIRAPEHTGNVGVMYEAPAFGGDLTLSGNFYFSSGFAWEPGNRVRQRSYQTVALRAAWSPQDSGFEIAASVSNLTNERYIQSESDSSAADGVSYAPPRWFRATLSMDF